jgi:hypothetical protein
VCGGLKSLEWQTVLQHELRTLLSHTGKRRWLRGSATVSCLVLQNR